jgi:hypothetical protein
MQIQRLTVWNRAMLLLLLLVPVEVRSIARRVSTRTASAHPVPTTAAECAHTSIISIVRAVLIVRLLQWKRVRGVTILHTVNRGVREGGERRAVAARGRGRGILGGVQGAPSEAVCVRHVCVHSILNSHRGQHRITGKYLNICIRFHGTVRRRAVAVTVIATRIHLTVI